jgi:hypothetical membrane protein
VSGDVPVASTHGAERRGPLVHRAVRPGAILLLLGAFEFTIAMAVAQLGWTVPYSLLTNYISDLGAVHCGYFPSSSAHYVCSPWHLVFNVGIVLLGLLLILAVLLIQSAFRPGKMRSIGLACLLLAGIGAIGVGLSPEDVNLTVHEVSALVAFLFGNLGMIVLGFAMFRDTRWDGFRGYSIISGLVGFVGLILYLSKAYGPLGLGGSERLIVAPILLWAVVVGIHLARIPTYAPSTIRPNVQT